METNEITGVIVDTAINIHKKLGPGLLESVYQVILEYELTKRGLHVEREKPIPVIWDNIRMDLGFRADLVVEGKVLVELKSVEETAPVHAKQVLTYLKISGMRVGLLINFGAALLKDGIQRIISGYDE
jgi:GxxExxY protein